MEIEYEIGPGLKVENGKLCVDTANVVEVDNIKPVTSNAVANEIGDLDRLLSAV